MGEVQLAFLLIILAGFLQGTFGIFIKNTAPLKWENFWLIFSLLSFIIGPLVFAFWSIPNLFSTLISLPTSSIYLPLFLGMIWGIGAITFGISVVKIGVALTYSIVLGLVTLLGTILPIFINKITFKTESLTLLIAGLVIVLVGVCLSGYAGLLKDKILNPKRKPALSGMMVAVVSGFFSSLLNVGFVMGKDISLHAETMRTQSVNSSALVWLVVLFGGFITNSGYALYLMVKHRSFNLYQKLNIKLALAILTASVFWFVTFALFGISSAKLGVLGPSVGWAMLFALSIIVSNGWGIKLGEWEGVKTALGYQLKSMGLIIIGIIFIAIAALY